jgi:hypothetical protein
LGFVEEAQSAGIYEQACLPAGREQGFTIYEENDLS